MKAEAKIQVARMAVDLTIALMADKNGHLAHLTREGKIPSGASPMAIFDEVHAHLLTALADAAD